VKQITSLLFSWLANAITLLVVILVLKKVEIGGLGALLGAAFIFGILNTFLKPILRFATIPFRILTLGLVSFLVSMLMLALTALIVPSFHIHGFWTLVIATIIVWVVNLLLDWVPGPWHHKRRD
jgi:putative membrane protein